MTADSGFGSGGGGGSGGNDAGSGENFWPPGFRFHPTDEELVLYYLKRKICRRRHKIEAIRELDVYKSDPEDLPGQSLLKTGDRQWFFFTARDRKYPNGARSNRATRKGYWKATGKDRNIMCNSRPVGVKKTLVFYRGRAPKGERTDWVMHEYTLDEAELSRCPNVKDYYALYKVFKKSGLGPKNGEQYGALFNEEEWADDEPANVKDPVTPNVPADVQEHIEAVNDNSVTAVGQAEAQFDDFEEFIRGLADGPAIELPQTIDHAPIPSQVAGKEEAESTLNDRSLRETIIPNPLQKSPLSALHYDDLVAFDFNQLGDCGWQLQEAPEVTSTPVQFAQSVELVEEDFLEIDDLANPDPIVCNTEKPSINENPQFDGFDGLRELDMYQDATMFLHDIGAVDQEIIYQQYNNAIVNQVDYQLDQHFIAGELMGNQFCVDGQSTNIITSSAANNMPISQNPSGPAFESTNNSNSLYQNQNGEESDGWLSSVLWSFVESIPTTPASASENPLVNKALERISSFSRVRGNVKNIDASVSKSSNVNRVRRTNGNRMLVLLAVFGALCAMLWILVGTVKLPWRSISL